MHSSYAELSQAQKEQVDAFLSNAKNGDLYSIADFQWEYLKEHVSNLVLTCLSIADMERWEKKNRSRKK